MRHPFLALATIAALVSVTPAQDAPRDAGPLKLERTVRLVGPAVPVLKYELLPPARERTPGNAALGYLRAATLMPDPPRDPKDRAAAYQKRLDWESTPIDKLPVAEVAEVLRPYRPTFRTLDAAARCRDCDWQAGPVAGEVAVNFSLLRTHRELSRLLRLRFRLGLAEGRPADALRALQTALQHARHVGEAGTVIELVVGQALANPLLADAEQLTARPGAPNFYWALATLPKPLIDFRPGLDGELRLTLSYLPKLAALEAGPVTEPVAAEAFRDHLRLLGDASRDAATFDNPLTQFAQAAGLALLAPAARDELVTRGRDRAEVDKMPAAQAVLLRAAAIHRELSDEQVAAFYLPYPQARACLDRVKERSKQVLKDHPNDVILHVFSLVLPTVAKPHEAVTRTERRLALFQAAEAVRLQAEIAGGRIPATLAGVSVPVPADPVTTKPFGYEVTPAGYRRTAPAPEGETPNLSNAMTLEVTVAR